MTEAVLPRKNIKIRLSLNNGWSLTGEFLSVRVFEGSIFWEIHDLKEGRPRLVNASSVVTFEEVKK